ncbi:hypothetical protein DFQ28_008640 [Apophysomyces sp. BC1034]|nr:hypothetical protein DFQ29_005841 [Apophysomyces sp. BC1021]KAG0185874.1 hypothetical protein DFQ28_008640 [Apophysomyces sp. BC1034]
MPLEYNNEPERPELLSTLIVRKDAPFNAEPPPPELVKHYITPIPNFFCRSHGPIPDLDESHSISFEGLGIHGGKVHITVEDLKRRFEKTHVMMAMQVIWGPCAVGNAVYGGCRLRDVLESIGVTKSIKDVAKLHVDFRSIEQCEEDSCYGSSIPLPKALDPFGDVLLAYEMNHAPLTRDHGHPIRVVVPGYIGARSVKFLKEVRIQDFESESYFQRKDYKILPDHIETEEQAKQFWCKMPAIGEYNIQSYVCDPSDGVNEEPVQKRLVSGYALSGGGRSIQRVDVSGDDGKSWTQAELYQPSAEGKYTHVWGWCLWTVRVDTKRNTRIVCRAVDSSGNIQQEYPVWNYRGVMNNSWRTVERKQSSIL